MWPAVLTVLAFAIVMAHVETMIVVYLRRLYYPGGDARLDSPDGGVSHHHRLIYARRAAAAAGPRRPAERVGSHDLPLGGCWHSAKRSLSRRSPRGRGGRIVNRNPLLLERRITLR